MKLFNELERKFSISEAAEWRGGTCPALISRTQFLLQRSDLIVPGSSKSIFLSLLKLSFSINETYVGVQVEQCSNLVVHCSHQSAFTGLVSCQIPVRVSVLWLREWQADLWIRRQSGANVLKQYSFFLYLSVSCHQYLRVWLLLLWQELSFDKWQCGCFCSWPRGVKVMDVPVHGFHHGCTQEQRQWSRHTFSAAMGLWDSNESPPLFPPSLDFTVGTSVTAWFLDR